MPQRPARVRTRAAETSSGTLLVALAGIAALATLLLIVVLVVIPR
jgi:hypothetical protein